MPLERKTVAQRTSLSASTTWTRLAGVQTRSFLALAVRVVPQPCMLLARKITGHAPSCCLGSAITSLATLCVFPPFSLRALSNKNVGELTAISGTVTRMSEVRPELVLGTFYCEDCGVRIANVAQQFKYVQVGFLCVCVLFFLCLCPFCRGFCWNRTYLSGFD